MRLPGLGEHGVLAEELHTHDDGVANEAVGRGGVGREQVDLLRRQPHGAAQRRGRQREPLRVAHQAAQRPDPVARQSFADLHPHRALASARPQCQDEGLVALVLVVLVRVVVRCTAASGVLVC